MVLDERLGFALRTAKPDPAVGGALAVDLLTGDGLAVREFMRELAGEEVCCGRS